MRCEGETALVVNLVLGIFLAQAGAFKDQEDAHHGNGPAEEQREGAGV